MVLYFVIDLIFISTVHMLSWTDEGYATPLNEAIGRWLKSLIDEIDNSTTIQFFP